MFLYKFLMLWTFLRAPLLAFAAQRLTIDTQLGTSVEDCFDRVSIGDQLSSSAIYRNVTELTTRECENACKQDTQCQTYDYGVGAKGNATCDLSNLNETTIREQHLMWQNPDYDIYVRRIQCEQAPPRPLLPQHDEPDSGNRPVLRPDNGDSIRPGYGPQRPYHVPLQFDERPDDYFNSKPDYNGPPSYGDHRPQDMLLRPDRPYQNQSLNGNPQNYDIMHFNGYASPGSRPESPYIQYIPRPYKKPYPGSKPQDDPYSVIPLRPNPNGAKPVSYGLGHPNGPIGPPDVPLRPNRPSYGYQSQQSSGYGDNSVQVIVRDPPRPPNFGHGCDHTYGPGGNGAYGQGGSYSSQSSYSQSQSSNSQFYGTITEIDSNGQSVTQRPQNNGPLRPSYGSQSQNYGGNGQHSESNNGGYGSQGQDTRPTYANNHGNIGHQGSYNSQSGIVGSQNYGGGSQSYYGSNKPHESDQSSYGNNQGAYGGQVHGSSQLYSDNQIYGGSQGSGYAGGNRPSSGYGGQESYGSSGSQTSNNGYQNAFGHNQYFSNNQGYSYNPSDNNKPYNNRPFYGNNQYGSGYDSSQGSYGGQQSYGSTNNFNDKPGNVTRPNNQSNVRPDNFNYNSGESLYRPDGPGYQSEKPGYNMDWPGYKPDELGYAPQQPGYGPSGPIYRPDYRPDRPGYRPNESGSGYSKPGTQDYKPVYEHESDKPIKGPNYDIKPDGHVVVSMPISIGDYGPGSKNPGQGLTYEDGDYLRGGPKKSG